MTAGFDGQVRTEWLAHPGQDRKMELLEDFTFLDRRGKRWQAKQGDVVDGASIPEVLWSSVAGTPFVGDYRRATVLHDVHCQAQTESHRSVHRMFYEAMRADGVSQIRARVMYLAVRTFGPRWGPTAETPTAQPDIDTFEEVLDAMLGE